jgi:hypothetical protein
MRRTLLIALALLVGSLGLLTLYAAIDFDPDYVSPSVQTLSYRAMFDHVVRRRAGAEYNALNESQRMNVLREIIESKEADPVREVALSLARDLSDRNGALQLLGRALGSLSPDLYEAAVGSIAALKTPAAQALLDSLHRSLDTMAVAHTPLGGYGSGSVVLSRENERLTARFNERSRIGTDYAAATAVENTLFFPASPDWFASFPNADDVMEDFEDSEFMEQLEDSPVPQEIWGIAALRPAAAYRNKLREKMGFIAGFFAPERLVQDNLSVAKYGDNYLLVTFKDKNFGLAERLIDVLESLGRDFGIRESKIDGIDVATIRRGASGGRLSYATIDEYVVAATDTSLLARAISSFRTDKGGTSLGIDPVFRSSYEELDQTGERDVAFLWMNPTRYFEMTGSENPAARRLAILSRALGKPVVTPAEAAAVPTGSGTLAATSFAGEDPMRLWRYIVDVRSLGSNAVDSLALLAGVDIGNQVVPYLSSTTTIGYSGIEFLRRAYGFSNTAFEMYATTPLRTAPPGFDTTLRKFFSGVTSLVYTADASAIPGTTLWMATDTSTNDPALREAKLQPSFAVLNGSTLVIASTPMMLRTVASSPASRPAEVSGSTYFAGHVTVDSFATNASRYLTAYLMRADRYPPEEVDARIDPLRRALSLFSTLDWKFDVEGGLRRGEAVLVSKM